MLEALANTVWSTGQHGHAAELVPTANKQAIAWQNLKGNDGLASRGMI